MSNGNSTAVLATDERAVRDVLLDAITAWSNGDAAAFAACYGENATVVVPGEYLKGRDEIRRHMEQRFAGPLKGTTIADRPESVRIIGGDAAIIISMAAIMMPGESEVPTERLQRATWVLSKTNDDWLVDAYTICVANAQA
jgi:uncharacterized protein (TIGR02246 family)